MNGASLLPRMSFWLLFSMTMVNTVPCQSGDGCVSVAVIALQVTAELPEVLAQPTALTAASPETSVSILRMCAKDYWGGETCNCSRAPARSRVERRALLTGVVAAAEDFAAAGAVRDDGAGIAAGAAVERAG